MEPRSTELLADLLIAWEDRFRMGQDTPAEELAREHPEIITALAQSDRGPQTGPVARPAPRTGR